MALLAVAAEEVAAIVLTVAALLTVGVETVAAIVDKIEHSAVAVVDRVVLKVQFILTLIPVTSTNMEQDDSTTPGTQQLSIMQGRHLIPVQRSLRLRTLSRKLWLLEIFQLSPQQITFQSAPAMAHAAFQ